MTPIHPAAFETAGCRTTSLRGGRGLGDNPPFGPAHHRMKDPRDGLCRPGRETPADRGAAIDLRASLRTPEPASTSRRPPPVRAADAPGIGIEQPHPEPAQPPRRLFPSRSSRWGRECRGAASVVTRRRAARGHQRRCPEPGSNQAALMEQHPEPIDDGDRTRRAAANRAVSGGHRRYRRRPRDQATGRVDCQLGLAGHAKARRVDEASIFQRGVARSTVGEEIQLAGPRPRPSFRHGRRPVDRRISRTLPRLPPPPRHRRPPHRARPDACGRIPTGAFRLRNPGICVASSSCRRRRR
jgi:hypothetical protein